MLVVWDESFEEVFYAAAESNPFDGSSVIYLGQFTPQGHSTLSRSSLLHDARVFLPAACRLARDYLKLDYRQAPLTAAENGAIALIPQICAQHFPNGAPMDEGSSVLLALIMESVLDANTSGGGCH